VADATAVIRLLGEQLAQAIVDKTIAQVELAEVQAKLAQSVPGDD
jgi:hypothetical protein